MHADDAIWVTISRMRSVGCTYNINVVGISLRDLMPMVNIDNYPDAPVEHMLTASKMGLNHPIEALLCAPDRYEDYRQGYTSFADIPDSAEFDPVVYQFKFKSDEGGAPVATGYERGSKIPLKTPWSKRCFRLSLAVQDAQGNDATITFFGSPFRWKDVPLDTPLVFRGKAKRYGPRLFLSEATPALGHKLGAISPVYLGEPGKQVSGQKVQAMIDWVMSDKDRAIFAVRAAVDVLREQCGEMGDDEILSLCTPEDSVIRPDSLALWLSSLHNPTQGIEEGDAARDIGARICALALQCRAYKQNTRPKSAKAPIGVGVDLRGKAIKVMERVAALQGFDLTRNQKEVALEIIERMQSDQPLNGLLNGEVGSGKTLSYAIPAVIAHGEGARVAILAPTDLLADQIARGIAEKFGISVQVERVITGRKINNPHAILVGTKGLITVANKIDYRPNLLICDEQQKMDTGMREALVADYTHTLDVSATPIPRSLALSLYEGVDLFTLNEQPVKRSIKTVLIDVKERGLATQAIKNAMSKGRRAAIVFTLVDGGKQSDDHGEAEFDEQKPINEEVARSLALKSAEAFEKHFPGRVALLHGKLKGKTAKIDALNAFRSGDKPLMVTTTIFETGIDVPDVSVLVIRDAQYLGMSQLHQLRGRLARNGGPALCILLVEDVDKLSDESYDRLTLFTQSQDGYTLAAQDMLSRGTGDLDGMQQQGRVSTPIKGIKLRARDLLMTQADLSVEAFSAEPNNQGHQEDQDHLQRTRQACLFA